MTGTTTMSGSGTESAPAANGIWQRTTTLRPSRSMKSVTRVVITCAWRVPCGLIATRAPRKSSIRSSSNRPASTMRS